MRATSGEQRMSGWVVDYSAARARAIAWLGDRYLLARPVKRRFGSAPGDTVALAGGGDLLARARS